MNSRIKQFAKEAKLLSGWPMDQADFQKFADLIVWECVELVSCNGHVSGFALGDLIKQHFGIDEC